MISDFSNQGVTNSTVTNTNVTTNSSGKLGGCCSFNGSDSYLLGTNAPLNNDTPEWSICCWLKVNSSHNGCIYSNRTQVSSNGIAIFYYSGAFIFDDGQRWQFTPRTTLSTNVWYHLAFTFKFGSAKKLYINGVLDSSTTTTTKPTTANVSNYTIGNSQQNATYAAGNPLNGYLNDFRVYDNELSAHEVAEIAKGLVLHYPLSGLSGMPNILSKSEDLTQWGKEANVAMVLDSTTNMFKETYSGTSTTRWGSYQDFDVSANTTYTLSCDMMGNGVGVGLGLYESSPNNWPAAVISSTSDIRKRYTYTFTTSATQVKARIYLVLSTSVTQVGYYCRPKIEVSPKATPYTPNPSETSYSAMGYNNTIEYDCSGFGYNGTRIGNPSVSYDTARYSVCTDFDGVDDCIQVPLNTFFPNAGSFTVNLWFKKSELGSKNYETVFGGISGFEIDTRNGGATTLSYYVTGNGRGLTVQSSLNFNEWYMATMVFDGTNELYYLNGEYKKQIEKKGMPTGNYFIGAWNSVTQQNFHGLISDFRVYATVLTAEDIAELYNP